MRNKVIIIIVFSLVALYAVLPLVAGIIPLGRMDGPRIYPQAYHRFLYSLAYEMRFGEQSRSRWNDNAVRPFFYSLDQVITRQ